MSQIKPRYNLHISLSNSHRPKRIASYAQIKLIITLQQTKAGLYTCNLIL